MRTRYAAPGSEFVLGEDGKTYEQPISADRAMQLTHAMGSMGLAGLGQHPQNQGGLMRDDPDILSRFNIVPQFYTISILLGSDEGNVQGGSVTLRPESFILERITWCTNGDVPPAVDEPYGAASVQGRSVEISWSDEFTKFLGSLPVLISALFGDSNGFLDIPKGLLLQGKQTLSVNLTRIGWPGVEEPPATTRFDFNFQGVGLLPKNAGSVSGAMR